MPIDTAFLHEVADAFSETLDLADSWANCGPETYTRQERKQRNQAERVLKKFHDLLRKEAD
jgi:hypothetical protein